MLHRPWFRRLFRKLVKPMSIDEAEEKREMFAKLYVVIAALCFGCLINETVQRGAHRPKLDETLPKHEALAKFYNVKGEVRHIKFKGLQKVEDITFASPYKEQED
ncbi:hypothetical protein RUM43_005339 [Polyplax serrata]|uniref:Uncharacterized protein n=1 Tax=Polyplax serrata TaxID=468196 RepID=A0AAN8NZW4_POLSC